MPPKPINTVNKPIIKMIDSTTYEVTNRITRVEKRRNLTDLPNKNIAARNRMICSAACRLVYDLILSSNV